MNWIDIKKQLPPDNTNFVGETYLVSVECNTWDCPKTMVMEWECTTIKNKEVKRWRWKGRIINVASWKITHWTELPKPATI